MGNAKHEAPPGTQAVVRAVRLLKAVGAARSSCSLQELCAEVGLLKPTAHRILAALESEGLVSQDPSSRRFRLGPEITSLASGAFHVLDLRTTARPILERLARDTGETATLEVPVGNEMLILDEVTGRHLVGAKAEIGTRWPIYATSTGKAILALLPDQQRRLQLSQPRLRLTTATLVKQKLLHKDLDVARKRGYATVFGELEEGFCAVGSACTDSSGEPIAALSVGGPKDRFTKRSIDQIGQIVCKAADELSAALR